MGKLSVAFRLEASRAGSFQPSTINLNVSAEQYRTALQRGLLIEESFQSHAGDRLRVVVMDQATGLAGAVWLPFGEKARAVGQ